MPVKYKPLLGLGPYLVVVYVWEGAVQVVPSLSVGVDGLVLLGVVQPEVGVLGVYRLDVPLKHEIKTH